jgi:hypothetical protein
MHCKAAEQAAPCARLTAQWFTSQKNPVWQSALWAQVEAHEGPMQIPGAQLRDDPGRQVPAPSQVLADSSTALAQLPATHSLPTAYLRHAPAPSQVPSSPQVETSACSQSPPGSSPAGTGVHVPRAPVRLQAWHAAVHGPPQQIPCAQAPEEH